MSSSGRTRVLLLPEQPGDGEEGRGGGGVRQYGRLVTFNHPGSGAVAQFLLTSSGDVCELQSIMPSGSKFGSWFVEQKVVSDGLLYVASPFDPKFLVLPVMAKHATRFSPLEQILANEPGAMELRSCRRLELHRICQVNDQLGDDMLLYRIDNDKTLEWLTQKVRRAQAKLSELEAARERAGSGAAFAAGFQASSTSSSTRPAPSAAAVPDGAAAPTPAMLPEGSREHLRTALELVCEYLDDDWGKKLTEHLGVTEDELKGTANKRSVWEPSEEDKAMELAHSKRQKADGPAAPGKAAGSGQSAAQKKLSKTNTKGMKSIASFFGKK